MLTKEICSIFFVIAPGSYIESRWLEVGNEDHTNDSDKIKHKVNRIKHWSNCSDNNETDYRGKVIITIFHIFIGKFVINFFFFSYRNRLVLFFLVILIKRLIILNGWSSIWIVVFISVSWQNFVFHCCKPLGCDT